MILGEFLSTLLVASWFLGNIGAAAFLMHMAVKGREGRIAKFALGAAIPAFLGLMALAVGEAENPFTDPLTLGLILLSGGPIALMVREWWADPEFFTIPAPPEALQLQDQTAATNPEMIQRLPDNIRTEHMMVVAGSGSGKTQLLQSLLLDDIDADAAIIVIDSQASLINNMLNVVPASRVVHITPTDKRYPLALNLFEKGQDTSLYEYIFQAFGGELTPQMTIVFRYVARLVSEIPGGNINTMRLILEKNGLEQFKQHIPALPDIQRSFFLTQYDTDRSVIESRQAVLRRVYAALENDTFAAMFSAPTTKLDIGQAMSDKKIILIDTAKGTLTGDTFKIFGRFFLAQIAKAMFSRTAPYPHRVYIYIDEFQEYAGEEGFVTELFTQARKWNVGLIVAFQYLAQMPDKVLRAIMSNTAIKFVGKVSASDRKVLAAEIGKADELMAQQKGVFDTNVAITYDIKSLDASVEHGYAYDPGGFHRRYTVQFGKLEKLGKRSRDELDNIRHRMREAYSWKPAPPKSSPPENPDDVDESGKW